MVKLLDTLPGKDVKEKTWPGQEKENVSSTKRYIGKEKWVME